MENESHHHHHHGGFTTEGTYDPLLVFSLSGIKKGDTVLDAGCGAGYLSMIASRMVGEEGKVHSYDVFTDGINILKMRREHGNFYNIDARVQDLTEPLPLDDSTIDLVIFSNVLHGFIFNEEIQPVLDNLNRVVKPGGRIVIVEFLKEETSIGPDITERFSAGEIASLLQPIGFTMEKTERLSENHYLAVFLRE